MIDIAIDVQMLPNVKLKPGPWQARKIFDREALEELALSIRKHGIMTPLRVVHSPREPEYLIVAGERGWRAASLAGVSEFP